MAEGRGILPDGTRFGAQFEGAPAHFQMVRKQALQHAEDVADRACEVWADDQSLYRLGLSRMLLAESENVMTRLRPEESVDQMQDAGRCFRRCLKLKPSEEARQR